MIRRRPIPLFFANSVATISAVATPPNRLFFSILSVTKFKRGILSDDTTVGTGCIMRHILCTYCAAGIPSVFAGNGIFTLSVAGAGTGA